MHPGLKLGIISTFIAFAVVAVGEHFLIPWLNRLKVDQTERVELESHQVKNGTPTMGGLMILVGILVSTVIAGISSGEYEVFPVLFLTLGFGIIGFVDDFLKVVLKRSDGLLAWQKMLLEIVVTTVFAVYMGRFSEAGLTVLLPMGISIDIGWLAYPLLYIAVLGTVNGVNFTDGLDGLSTSVTIPVAIFFTIASVFLGAGIEGISGAVAGGLLGFLLYNAHPARVFMGDTGSLALGGFVAGAAYMLRMPWLILIVGLIYVIEVFSVVLQVSYFKATHGKRIFRMAPIHHHFELGGWSETKVVAVFMVVTILLCLAGLLLLGVDVF